MNRLIGYIVNQQGIEKVLIKISEWTIKPKKLALKKIHEIL